MGSVVGCGSTDTIIARIYPGQDMISGRGYFLLRQIST